MAAPIAAVDREGRQSFVNPAFCQLVGWTEDELLGQLPPFVYWPPDELPVIQTAFDTALKGLSPPTGFELRLHRKNGEQFIALVQPAPMVDSKGELLGWVASVQDIGHLKQTEATLREREQFIARVTRAVPDIIHVYDFREQRQRIFESSRYRHSGLQRRAAPGNAKSSADANHAPGGLAKNTRMVRAPGNTPETGRFSNLNFACERWRESIAGFKVAIPFLSAMTRDESSK